MYVKVGGYILSKSIKLFQVIETAKIERKSSENASEKVDFSKFLHQSIQYKVRGYNLSKLIKLHIYAIYMQKERDFMLLMTYISNILIYIYAISAVCRFRQDLARQRFRLWLLLIVMISSNK